MLKFDGSKLSEHGTKIAELKSDTIYDAHGGKIGGIRGDTIYDKHGSKIASVHGENILDAHGSKIGTLRDARREIDGPGGTSLGAFWFLFVR